MTTFKHWHLKSDFFYCNIITVRLIDMSSNKVPTGTEACLVGIASTHPT